MRWPLRRASRCGYPQRKRTPGRRRTRARASHGAPSVDSRIVGGRSPRVASTRPGRRSLGAVPSRRAVPTRAATVDPCRQIASTARLAGVKTASRAPFLLYRSLVPRVFPSLKRMFSREPGAVFTSRQEEERAIYGLLYAPGQEETYRSLIIHRFVYSNALEQISMLCIQKALK